jgi:hypothetical protein
MTAITCTAAVTTSHSNRKLNSESPEKTSRIRKMEHKRNEKRREEEKMEEKTRKETKRNSTEQATMNGRQENRENTEFRILLVEISLRLEPAICSQAPSERAIGQQRRF